MEGKTFWHLENIDVTGIFCQRKMMDARDEMTHKSFKKGEYVYLTEEHSKKIYFIANGRIKIGKYGDQGKEITKSVLEMGEIFGELALVHEDKRKEFAVAMEDTMLCILSVEEMNALIKDHSSLGLFMMKLIGNRTIQMEKRLESLVFKDSRTRIVEYLKELVATKGQQVGYEYVIRKPLTHQDIANLTATSRQTVTTVLNDLKSKNILTFNRRRLLIRDLENLV